jgi:fibronectin-binding autotransporter adhesin
VEGAVSGLGDVTLQANSTGSVLLGGSFNAAGLLINAGAGDGEVRLSGSIGSEVTGITQSSVTSRLFIEGATSNTYAGLTRVTAGELVVNGNMSNGGGTTVLSEGTLSGSGTLASASIAGAHSPGNSPGLQTFTQNLSYETSAEVVWELVASTTSGRGVNYDGIDVGGNLAFAGATSLRLIFDLPESGVMWSDSFWNANRQGSSGWLVFNVTGETSGFANLNILPEDWVDAAGQSFSLSRSQASFGLAQVGSDVYLTYTAVPEPRVYILLGLAAALLALRGGLRSFSDVGRGCRGSGRRGS